MFPQVGSLCYDLFLYSYIDCFKEIQEILEEIFTKSLTFHCLIESTSCVNIDSSMKFGTQSNTVTLSYCIFSNISEFLYSCILPIWGQYPAMILPLVRTASEI